MTIPFLGKLLPSWKNLLFAVLAAALLILAFPDFEFWFLAWFALVPLMWAVEREKASTAKSLVLGWVFGIVFFFGTCWWLTFAPIHYAGFPPILAYFLLFCVTAITGLFPGVFAGILSILLRRFGSWGFLAAPFVWVCTEFLRYLVTGNNWNAIGYSQAFYFGFFRVASAGGVLSVGFFLVLISSLTNFFWKAVKYKKSVLRAGFLAVASVALIVIGNLFMSGEYSPPIKPLFSLPKSPNAVIALQPDVPMMGLDSQKWEQHRQRQIDLAEGKIKKLLERRIAEDEERIRLELPQPEASGPSTLVILPESPMNFMYSDDRDFQLFIGDFARRNNVSVLFNSAEPDIGTTKYFNSAVMVGRDGREVGEYDKIYLLPFGEAVPWFLEGIVPGFVGNFAYGSKYDLMPVGDGKAGVMICFESHFGQLSREYVRNGADVIIEMTNDGYLGPTPVLRQHLANAVFRAVETNRPVLRVTNVGITAYIDEKGRVLDATTPYQEDTRVWSVSKSDGSQTFYVKYGDWFAWLCSAVTIIFLISCLKRRSTQTI